MIRRSLTFAFRAFAHTRGAQHTPLITTTSRFFSFSEFDREDVSNERSKGRFERNDSRAQQYNNSERGPQKRVFNQEVFEGMAKLSNNDILEFLFKQKGDLSTEVFMFDFFSGLSTVTGYKAWAELSPEAKKQVAKNFIFMVEESIAVGSKFSTPSFSRSLFKLMVSGNDFQLINETMQSLFKIMKSTNAKFLVMGNYLSSARGHVRPSGYKDFRESIKFCLQTASDILRDMRFKIDQRNLDQISLPVAYIFEALVDFQGFDQRQAAVLIQFFTNVQLNELGPKSIVVGYSSLASLVAKYKIDVVLNNESNAEYMNYIIEKNLLKEGNSNAQDTTNTKSKDGANDRKEQRPIEKVETAKPLTAEQLQSFIQAFVMEHGESWPNILSILKIVSDNSEFRHLKMNFRRWIIKRLYDMDISNYSGKNLRELVEVAANLLSPNGSPGPKFKILKQLYQTLPQINEQTLILQVLNLFSSFVPIIKKDFQESQDRILSIFEREMKQDDKDFILTSFDKIKNSVFDENRNFGFNESFFLIRQMLSTFNALTAEEMKATRLHKETWDKTLKRPFIFGNSVNEIIRALDAYDLKTDNDMQKIFIEVLNKLEAQDSGDAKSHAGEDKGDTKIEVTKRRLPRAIDELYVKFSNDKDNLQGEALVLFQRLDKFVGDRQKGEKEVK